METIKANIIKRIHVNQHNIRSNCKGKNLPVMTVKTSKKNIICREVSILGPSKLVYKPTNPMSCGARVWIETKAEVKVKL